MTGNKGFSFDRLVGAFVEIVETVNDSQVNDSAGDDAPCDQKRPIPAKPGLGPFQCSPAEKPKMTERRDKARSCLQELRMRTNLPSRRISRSAETWPYPSRLATF